MTFPFRKEEAVEADAKKLGDLTGANLRATILQECPVCDGDGFLRNRNWPCKMCKGTGSVRL